MKKLVAVLAVAAWLAPPAAVAQERVATAVVYEVNEALRFLKARGRDRSPNQAEFARRLAHASLLGKEVKPVGDHDIFRAGSFIQASATSTVDLRTGRGPISGKLQILTDIDPTRESLDTLVIDVEAKIRGQLDLTTATQGFATLSGTWTPSRRSSKRGGTMQGVFLIPFHLGDERYLYLDLGVDGPGTLCGSADGLCPLTGEEFALGIPLTKLVVAFAE